MQHNTVHTHANKKNINLTVRILLLVFETYDNNHDN